MEFFSIGGWVGNLLGFLETSKSFLRGVKKSFRMMCFFFFEEELRSHWIHFETYFESCGILCFGLLGV